MKSRNAQLGAGLVELMVAMAIGVVIALGAGQLFLSTFSTFRSVDELSRKQEVVVFLTQIVAEDVRKEGRSNRYVFSCGLENGDCRCTIRDSVESGEPLIDFYKDFEAGSGVSAAQCNESQQPLVSPVDGSQYQYMVGIPMWKDGASLAFQVTHRAVVTATPSGE